MNKSSRSANPAKKLATQRNTGTNNMDTIRRMKKPNKQGGARPGAGRKPGKTVVNSSITMEPHLWVKLDAIKGEKSRSAWIADRVRRAR